MKIWNSFDSTGMSLLFVGREVKVGLEYEAGCVDSAIK
jgi:hypothetical protein